MRKLALILALSATLCATDVAAQDQGPGDRPQAGDESGSRQQRRQRRRGRRCGCRNAPSGQREGRGGGCRRGRSKGDAGQRNRGSRRDQGACALGAVPKATQSAKPEYIERLQQALASELYARDYYAAAAKSLAGVRRFSNLERAEERHAQAIRSVITAFGAKPVEPKPAEVVAPKTLAEADGHCRGIEQKVIEFYDKLIADCPDEGIRQVLQRIQTANHRHLQAVGG